MSRFCTESPASVKFFIGSSPSMATKIISPDFPAEGVMISISTLRNRQSDFPVGAWILDSGAFTEITKYGGYRSDEKNYCEQINRWSKCGQLLAAVSQDWMCEPFALAKTGLNVETHQRLTIKRYDALVSLDSPVRIMPVLQGYRSSDYLAHLQQYGDRLQQGVWVGVGSVCRRNGDPSEIANLLRGIKLMRPDLRLHGFGLKILALENPEVRSLLHSCDSMAWSYPLRYRPGGDCVQNRVEIARDYQQKIHTVVSDCVQKRVPATAGANNGQGRKPKWKSATKAMRLPAKFEKEIYEFDRDLENS